LKGGVAAEARLLLLDEPGVIFEVRIMIELLWIVVLVYWS
jgi:hypothetical protein